MAPSANLVSAGVGVDKDALALVRRRQVGQGAFLVNGPADDAAVVGCLCRIPGIIRCIYRCCDGVTIAGAWVNLGFRSSGGHLIRCRQRYAGD